MYAVTDAYNEAMESAVRNKSWIKIQFGIVDPDAAAAATLSNNGSLSYDNTQGSVVGATSPATYATLEQNRWILDGRNPIPVTDNPNYQGYVGNLISSSDCTWSTNPQVVVTFDDYFQFAALTFMFDQSMDEYPSSFQVQAYHDDELVHDITESPTDSYWNHQHQIPICNKIVLTWLKSVRPYRRARMTSLIFGFGQSITQSEMESCSATKNFDIQSTAFPKNDFDLTLIDTTKSYDPENPNGVWEYLESRQPIDVSIGYSLDENDNNIEWIPWIHAYTNGDFSVSGSDAYTLVTIKGVGLIEHMTMTYNSSKYYPDGRSLYDMAYDVINASGYSNVIEVDSLLKNIITKVPLPSGQSNTLLQMIANAACSVMHHNRGGVLQIGPESSLAADFNMDFSKMTSTPETAKTPPLRYITTKYHPVSVESEVATVVNEQKVEVNGGGGVYAITNLITNGSFESGISGWEVNTDGTLSQSAEFSYRGSYSLKSVSTKANTYNGPKSSNLISLVDISHKYYYCGYGLCTNVGGSEWYGEIARTSNGVNTYISIYNGNLTTLNEWVKGTVYIDWLNADTTKLWLAPVRGRATGAVGMTLYCDAILFVDLTATFGAGNEPDKAWCDEHLNYFEGTVYITKNGHILTNLTQNAAMEELPDSYYNYIGINASTEWQKYNGGGWFYNKQNFLLLRGDATGNEIYTTSKYKIPVIAGHKYYNSVMVYNNAHTSGNSYTTQIYMPYVHEDRTVTPQTVWVTVEAFQWKKVSMIITATQNVMSQFRFDYNNEYGTENMWFTETMCIDLTESFGAGNEPTKEWCDENIPFFESTKVLDDTAVEITFNHEACTNQTLTTNGTLYVGEPEFFAYKTVVPLLGNGTVTIAGNKLTFGDIEYTKKFGEVGEDLNSMDNQLIDSYDMCATYADWLANCVQRRNSYKASDRGYPQLDVGDNITISTNFNQDVPVTITEQSITYNGAISGSQSYIITDGEKQ